MFINTLHDLFPFPFYKNICTSTCYTVYCNCDTAFKISFYLPRCLIFNCILAVASCHCHQDAYTNHNIWNFKISKNENNNQIPLSYGHQIFNSSVLRWMDLYIIKSLSLASVSVLFLKFNLYAPLENWFYLFLPAKMQV